MQESTSFKVRAMNLNDLTSAMNLSYSEGWNQTEKDWRLLLDNPANICLVVEAGGNMVGTATAMNYCNKVAWIGMVLIDKDFRGHGAGKLILNYLIDKLKNFDSIKLDATPAGYPLYLKSGFEDELIINRMTNNSLGNFLCEDIRRGIEFITTEDLSDVIKYDRKIFGVDRTYLLEIFLRNYPDKAILLRRNNKIVGYMLGREGIRFNYIGPVFAESSDEAKILISEALKSLVNKPVALDIMQDKEDLADWLQSIGFSTQRHFNRMYLGRNNYSISRNQFLICGPELG